MKNLLLILTFLSILTFGCKKEAPIEGENFALGDLTIGITSKADVNAVFDTLNALNFKIASMQGFYYNANFPADSLEPLLTFLNTKPYINTGTGWTASGYYYEPEKSIRVLCNYFDMTLSNQLDFLNTVDSLRLVERQNDTKNMLIKVPPGTEKYWVNELKKYSFIKWVELNHIVKIRR